MNLSEWLSAEWFGVPLLPFIIFFARVGDVSIGTMRIMLLSRGRGLIAPMLGVAEVTIWLIAVSQVIQNLDSPVNFVAYVAGYATGNYVGLWLEDRLAIGNVMIRLVTRTSSDELIQALHAQNYRVTYVDATGRDGYVQILFMVVKRKQLDHVISIINEFNPAAYFSIEDVRYVKEENLLTTPASPVLRK